MSSKIMTKYTIRVIEYDSTGYYYPKYTTDQKIITDSIEEAKEKAIERTPMKHNFGGGWVQRAEVLTSEDIVVDLEEGAGK